MNFSAVLWLEEVEGRRSAEQTEERPSVGDCDVCS